MRLNMKRVTKSESAYIVEQQTKTLKPKGRISSILLDSKSKISAELQDRINRDPVDHCRIRGVVTLSNLSCICRQIYNNTTRFNEALSQIGNPLTAMTTECNGCNKQLSKQDIASLTKLAFKKGRKNDD